MRFSSVGVLGLTLAFILACGGGETITEPVIPPGDQEIAEVPLAVPVGGAADQARKCADGREASLIWQGEYPGPIVDVTTPLTTEVQTDLCGVAPKRQCTIAAALYHPWARETKAEYVTVRGIDRYIADKEFPVEGKTLPAGTVVEVVAYMGEGYCALRANGEELSGTCPDMISDDAGNALAHRDGPESAPEEQFVGVDCTEGGKGYWLVNDAIFQLPGVKQGELVEYGQVKGAGTEPLPPG